MPGGGGGGFFKAVSNVFEGVGDIFSDALGAVGEVVSPIMEILPDWALPVATVAAAILTDGASLAALPEELGAEAAAEVGAETLSEAALSATAEAGAEAATASAFDVATAAAADSAFSLGGAYTLGSDLALDSIAGTGAFGTEFVAPLTFDGLAGIGGELLSAVPDAAGPELTMNLPDLGPAIDVDALDTPWHSGALPNTLEETAVGPSLTEQIGEDFAANAAGQPTSIMTTEKSFAEQAGDWLQKQASKVGFEFNDAGDVTGLRVDPFKTAAAVSGGVPGGLLSKGIESLTGWAPSVGFDFTNPLSVANLESAGILGGSVVAGGLAASGLSSLAQGADQPKAKQTTANNAAFQQARQQHAQDIDEFFKTVQQSASANTSGSGFKFFDLPEFKMLDPSNAMNGLDLTKGVATASDMNRDIWNSMQLGS